MLIGYARVSTAEQVADHQVDALVRAGVAPEDVHVDVASGARASRPKLDLVLRLARAGDVVVVTRLDRLGRSLLHLVQMGAGLRERGIELRVLEQGIDTTTAEGRAMYGMLSVLAELQRELIVANTRDGLAAARARGRKGGRRPKLTAAQAALAQRLYDEREKTVKDIAGLFGVTRGTLYGYLRTTTAQAASSDHVSTAEPVVDAADRTPEVAASADEHPKRVHIPAGTLPAGEKIKAVCTCGWTTRPRPDETRALASLESQHGYQSVTCQACGRDRQDVNLTHRERFAHLQILTDPDTGDQLLICADDQQACRDAAARRQIDLRQAAFDALQMDLPGRPLRLVVGSPGSDD